MAKTRFDSAWAFGEALEVVQQLVDPLQKAGFAIGLTGSVLIKSKSEHDLDIIIYPLQSTSETDFTNAREVLLSSGFRILSSSKMVRAHWRTKGFLDEKEVEIWHLHKRRVDVFFLK